MDVKISIIIPAYNVEKYIKFCLESLFAQTMTDLEIICIDDCSDDGTYNIIKEYEKRYPYFRGMRNDYNMGAANTRNRGLQKAVGEYVIFLDADDKYHPQFLEKMYNAATEKQADCSVCQANYYDKDGNLLQCSGWNENLIQTVCLTENDNRQKIFQSILHAPWNKLVRRKFLIDYGIMFQDLPNANDVYYSMMVVSHAKKIAFVPEVLIYYRYERAGNLTDGKKTRSDYTISAYEEVLLQLKKRNMWHGDIKKSFINDVIVFVYSRVVYSTKEFSEQYYMDYCKKIRPLLCDEEVKQNAFSKWIYYNYKYLNKESLFCNNKYVLYCGELEDYLEGQKNKRLALWGAGKLGQKFLSVISKSEHSIQYIVDNDVEKQGGILHGIEICSYESVKDKVDQYLVLSDRFIKAINDQVGDVDKIVNIETVLERFEMNN